MIENPNLSGQEEPLVTLVSIESTQRSIIICHSSNKLDQTGHGLHSNPKSYIRLRFSCGFINCHVHYLPLPKHHIRRSIWVLTRNQSSLTAPSVPLGFARVPSGRKTWLGSGRNRRYHDPFAYPFHGISRIITSFSLSCRIVPGACIKNMKKQEYFCMPSPASGSSKMFWAGESIS